MFYSFYLGFIRWMDHAWIYILHPDLLMALHHAFT